MDRRLLNVKEVAEFLSISVPRVYSLVSKDILPIVRVGRQIRFAPEALEDFVSNGGKGFQKFGRRNDRCEQVIDIS